MLPIFLKGGPVMWPLLLTSIVALTVILERTVFILRSGRKRALVDEMFSAVENAKADDAAQWGEQSKDFVARPLGFALRHRDVSFSSALVQAAGLELQRFNRGIAVLDTVVTLAPLLGLFGTVTGMIHAFGLLGTGELGAPAEITGGIAEALIATAFGLLIAMAALLPLNYLNSRLERARLEIEEAGVYLEILLQKTGQSSAAA